MSGWDEGNVFYSDQNVQDEEERQDSTTSNHIIKKKLKEFIRSFHDPQYNERFIYRYLRYDLLT